MQRDPQRGWLVGVQFCALAAAWGSSFLLIKVSLEGLSPGQVVLGRLSSGAVALWVILAARRQRPPRERAVWLHTTVVSVLLCVAPFLLFAWAEQHISSGLASIYNATTPLMTMLVALAALPSERPDARRLTGLAAGLIGVLVVIAPWNGQLGGEAAAQLACLLATASYGAAFVYLRRYIAPRGLPAVTVAAMQVGIGTVITAVLTPWIGSTAMHLDARVLGCVLTLGVIGTGLAYLWNTNIVTAWGATRGSTVTYLTPVVGVLLGVVILGEKLAWNQPIGALIVIAGIAISQRNPRRPAPRLELSSKATLR